jgi:hypothetical protein
MLLAGQGGDHLTSSMIYHSSTVTCIPTAIVGGSTICSTMINASCIGIGTSTPTDQLSIYNSVSNSPATLRLAGSNRGGQINFYNQQYPTGQILVDQSGNIDFSTGVFAGASVSTKFSIANTGGACFACSVSAPTLNLQQNSNSEVQLLAINNQNCTGTSSVARMDIGNWIAQYALTIGRNGICTTGTRFGDNQANTTFIFDNAVSSCGMYIGNASSGGNLHLITGAEKRLTINSSGISCFFSTICTPLLSINSTSASPAILLKINISCYFIHSNFSNAIN